MSRVINLIIKKKLDEQFVRQYIDQIKRTMKDVEVRVVNNLKSEHLKNVADIVKDVQKDFLSGFSLTDQKIVIEGIIKTIIRQYEEKVKAGVHPKGWQSPNLNTYWVRTGTTKKSVADKVKTYKKSGGFTIFGAVGSSEGVTFEGLVKFRKRYSRTGYRVKNKHTTYYYFYRFPKNKFKLRSRKNLTKEQKLAENRRMKFAFRRNRLFRVFNRDYSGFMRKVVKTKQVRGRKYKSKSIWYSRRIHKPYKIFHILESGRKAVSHFGPFSGYHYAKNVYQSFKISVQEQLSGSIDKIINKVVKKLKSTLARQEKALMKNV